MKAIKVLPKFLSKEDNKLRNMLKNENEIRAYERTINFSIKMTTFTKKYSKILALKFVKPTNSNSPREK